MNSLTRYGSALAFLACAVTPSQAQTFPDRPIRLVVPYSAGSASDMLARTISQPLSAALGQPIVIDNKPGGNSTIGTSLVANAAPDGYTIGLAANSGLAASPAGLTDAVPYDPAKDLGYVSMVGKIPFVLLVNSSVKVASAKEFVEHVRANPGKLNYASGNTGGIAYMGYIKNSYKLDITHVPYKSTPPALVDLLGGQVQVMMADVASAGSMIRNGQVKALAIASEERNPQLPQVPTFPESGLPMPPDMSGWWALITPAGVPDAILERLNTETAKVLALPRIREALTSKGITATPSTREQAIAYQREQFGIWKRMVEELNLRQ